MRSRPIRNYIICATPRSGSNVLCEMLASLGFAGRPYEHLWVPEGTEPEELATRWPRIIKAATGANGVFGIKLMWYQGEHLERELPAVLGMPEKGLGDALREVLDNPAYIFQTRTDRVRQAISFVRAMQTRQWRSMGAPARMARYDRAAIGDAVRWLEENERDWEAFFNRHDISPYRLLYEDLAADARNAIAGLLTHLGYKGSLPVALPDSQHLRQADGETEVWVERYLRDRPAAISAARKREQTGQTDEVEEDHDQGIQSET